MRGARPVDDTDPFLPAARQRSCSPGRAASAPPLFHQDHESLLSLYTSTGGGSWRTAIGWPAFRDVCRQSTRRTARLSPPSVEPPTTSRNPFGEKVNTAVNGHEKCVEAEVEGAAGTARAAGGACAQRSLKQGSCGGGSPANPFVPKRKSVSPLNPFRPASSQDSSSSSGGALRVATTTERHTQGAKSPTSRKTSPSTATAAAAAVPRVTQGLSSPTMRSDSPPRSAPRGRSVRGRSPSAPPPANVPGGRSAFLDPPRKRDSDLLQAGAAWFGVSLGTAKRVTELKLVDNGLVGTLPADLDGLAMLRYLHLGRNRLSGTLILVRHRHSFDGPRECFSSTMISIVAKSVSFVLMVIRSPNKVPLHRVICAPCLFFSFSDGHTRKAMRNTRGTTCE